MSESSAYRGRERGLTLVELSVMLILLALLAVFIAPRLNIKRFDELGFFQETLAAVRYAHKVAVASGCPVQVTVTPGAGGGVALQYAGGDCGAGEVANPTTASSQFATTAPAGVVVTGSSFTYDMIGNPSGTGDISITITNSDATSRQIRVTDVTGFAFQP